jgi:hypothetical protein
LVFPGFSTDFAFRSMTHRTRRFVRRLRVVIGGGTGLIIRWDRPMVCVEALDDTGAA